MMNKLILIAAVSNDGSIGNDNGLLFKIRDDMRNFRETTIGNHVIMGRKTWESLGRIPLPKRFNHIVTNNSNLQACKTVSVANLNKTLANIKIMGTYSDLNVYVIGGGEIYNQTIDLADELIITHVDSNKTGDVKFPTIDMNKWIEEVGCRKYIQQDQWNECSATIKHYIKLRK